MRPRQPVGVVLLGALTVLLCLPALGDAPGRGVQAQAVGGVVLLEARGIVDPFMAQYLARGLATAAERRAELVVIEMDTPGGLDSAMREIVQAILNAPLPVAVYVGPSGARAASAGLFIAMAAHVAAMAPGTNIGAAHPVDLSQQEISATVEDKVTNDAVAYIRSIAEQRGRNADWAEEAVRQSASLTAQQAAEQGVVDLLASDVSDLLAKLHGREVAFDSRTVTLHTEGAQITPEGMTLFEGIAHGLVNPNIAYLLLTLGTIALVAELYNPGAILPGVTGVICLILAFVALGNLPVNWGGIGLILFSFALFVLDIKVAGFALSVAGVISFVLGSLLLFSPFGTPTAPALPRVYVSPWLVGGMTTLLVGFLGLVITAGVRAHRRRSLMGAHLLPGKVGTAVSALAPHGVVQVQSETWSATALDGPVDAGDAVEVVGSDGLRLQVRRHTEKRG
ncbi:MAG: nodulation protein NfeD [Chloroflexi bacterium]|nr:nodulation protein NfeD [Chloroflexota bacterium]